MAQRIAIEDVELAFEDSGDGPAVALVHGLGGSHFGWRAQTLALVEAGYRAVAYDQRGAGLSSKPAGPYSIDRWAADLIALLDARGIDRVALVGHSMGCMVAERAAAILAGRCWALALCGGVAEWPQEARPAFSHRAELAQAGRMDDIAEGVAMSGLSERCRSEEPALWGLMVASIAASDPDGYAQSALATAEGRMAGLERLRCPVLAFAGGEDPVTPPAAAERIAATVPDGEAATIEGAAHWCMLEAPLEVSELLLQFLRRHQPG